MRVPQGWQLEKDNLFEGDDSKIDTFLPKLDRKLRRLLKRVPADSVHFRLRASYRKPSYHVRLTVRSPLGAAFAVAQDEQLVAALKEAGERVARQLQQAREKVVLAYQQARAARRAARKQLAEQVRAVWNRVTERETLVWLLRSAVRDLRRHLEAEFAVLQAGKKLPPGYRLDDLFDEVVARALEKADRIDLSRETLDTVLLRLAHERLDELASQEDKQTARLEDFVSDDALQQDENWIGDNDPWWPEQPALLLEDLLPGEAAPEGMTEEEEARLVSQALLQLAPQARRALLLSELEGLETAEIAEALGQGRDSVRKSLSSARNKVREAVLGR